MSIAVSRVLVTQHVVFWQAYILESSRNLSTWVSTGEPFLAESEEIAAEFIAAHTGHYFRIQEVP